MGAVFALASATNDITTARPEAVADGMRMTFAVAALLNVVALAVAAGGRALARRAVPPKLEHEEGRVFKSKAVAQRRHALPQA
jgi:hypothetical protein